MNIKPSKSLAKVSHSTRTPWAQAHRKQRAQEKTIIHPKGGSKK